MQRAWFATICSQANTRIGASRVPAYIQDALPDEVLGRLTKESGLPRTTASDLRTVAVALHIALAEPKRPGAKDLKREVERFFRKVKALATAAKLLSPWAWIAITGPTVRIDDRSTEIETWEQSRLHVLENAEAALRDLLKLRRTTKVPRGSAGRRLPPAALAEIYLDNLLAQHARKLSLQARRELSDTLFEDVKHRGVLRSKGKKATRSEAPRSRDLIRRTPKRRTARK